MHACRLSDLIDLTVLQKMTDAHYRATGIPVGIIDAFDGSILVGSGWQDICVKFHRVNPISLQRCKESDRYISGRIIEGEALHYKCKNGLWDIGVPIVVAERHLATMFLGQFFYEGEVPDRAFFIGLAHELGFDVDSYLAALDRVPVFSREKVDYILEYDKALVNFVAEIAGKSLSKFESDMMIRESERKFQAIFDQAYTLFGILSTDGQVLEANKIALRFSNAEEAEVIGKSIWEVPWWDHSPELREEVRRAVQRASRNESTRFGMTRSDAGGNLQHIDFCIKPISDEAGNVVLLVQEGRDVTEHMQAQEALRKGRDELEARVRERTAELESANEELRGVPSKLIEAQEEERKRLSSELHDSIGQTLAALKFRTEFILKTLQDGKIETARRAIEDLVPTIQRSIEETRAIYMGLRPKVLEDFGVIAALRWFRDELLTLYPEMHIEIDIGIEEQEIPRNLVVPIFRIAQEALNNVSKHSRAEWVDLSLSLTENGIELVVSDDGIGMKVNQILLSSTAKSLGLMGMRERVEMFGGSFFIDSAPGEGTTVRACWPVKAEGQAGKV